MVYALEFDYSFAFKGKKRRHEPAQKNARQGELAGRHTPQAGHAI